MKIQCDICMKKPASIMCCADEAALCDDCDKSIHFANKLSLKHQRVTLLPPLDLTMCDMCKDKPGFFFCTQDRALLCRDCDVTIHSGNQFKINHTRLLVTGARVGLEALPNGEAVSVSSDAGAAELGRPPPLPPRRVADAHGVARPSQPPVADPHAQWTMLMENSVSSPSMTPNTPQLAPSVPAYSPRSIGMDSPQSNDSRASGNGVGGAVGNQVPNDGSGHIDNRNQYNLDFFSEPLRVEDILNLPNISGYQFGDVASSKADDMLGSQYDWNEWSMADELRVMEDSFHQVPSMSGATGHHTGGRVGRAPVGGLKGKGKQESRQNDYDDSFVVPDMGYHSAPASPPVAKRRRQ